MPPEMEIAGFTGRGPPAERRRTSLDGHAGTTLHMEDHASHAKEFRRHGITSGDSPPISEQESHIFKLMV